GSCGCVNPAGRAGVSRLAGGGWCTVEQASRFFSYRRDRVTGRMVAAVWLERRG
ncbi:MAG TPA: laccase domain-containing protein, partial [Piscinibacter sp.]|nr:laccase domain-containing protein [Piscinibacter sp.]